jgi:hypothetical protein
MKKNIRSLSILLIEMISITAFATTKQTEPKQKNKELRIVPIGSN